MNVASAGINPSVQAHQRAPEANEGTVRGPDRDGDADDRGAKVAQQQPTATVNTSGQQIGKHINVTA